MTWEAADKVQKNAAGEYRAMIGGAWVPVAKAQKSASGQYRIERAEIAQPEQPLVDGNISSVAQAKSIANMVAGGLKGASQIGATILAPIDYLAQKTGISNSFIGRDDRRQAVTQGLQEMGADPNSFAYKGGEIGAEIAGTAGLPGAIGGQVAKIAPRLGAAITSGGFSTGAPATRALSIQGARNAAIRIGGGAASGAAMAGAIDPEQAGTGAMIGGAIPIAGKLAGESGRLLKEYVINPLFRPSKAAMNKLVQDAGGIEQAKAAIDRAIKAGKTMSGESYTLGQAGKNAGLASTERARSAVNPENYQPIYQAQREARVKALQGIGQDEVALENAIATRSGNAKTAYGAVNNKEFPVTEDLVKLAHRAKSGGAIGEAQKIAGIEGRAFSTQQMDDIGQVIGEAVKGGDLHSVKMGIDQAIGNATGHQKAALVQLKNEFLDWMGKQSPEYLAANAKYAADSRPINQMKVAQKLTDILTGEAYKHGANASQNSASFYRALKNAPSIAKSETGMKQPLSKIFDEGQLSTIKQVAKELAKDVDLQNLGRGVGSDTAQKMARSNLLSSLAELVNTSRVGRAAANVVSFGAKGRLNARLDALLTSPEYAGKALDGLTKPQRHRLATLLANPAVRALPIAAQSK